MLRPSRSIGRRRAPTTGSRVRTLASARVRIVQHRSRPRLPGRQIDRRRPRDSTRSTSDGGTTTDAVRQRLASSGMRLAVITLSTGRCRRTSVTKADAPGVVRRTPTPAARHGRTRPTPARVDPLRARAHEPVAQDERSVHAPRRRWVAIERSPRCASREDARGRAHTLEMLRRASRADQRRHRRGARPRSIHRRITGARRCTTDRGQQHAPRSPPSAHRGAVLPRVRAWAHDTATPGGPRIGRGGFGCRRSARHGCSHARWLVATCCATPGMGVGVSAACSRRPASRRRDTGVAAAAARPAPPHRAGAGRPAGVRLVRLRQRRLLPEGKEKPVPLGAVRRRRRATRPKFIALFENDDAGLHEGGVRYAPTTSSTRARTGSSDYVDLGAVQPWDTSLISNFCRSQPQARRSPVSSTASSTSCR